MITRAERPLVGAKLGPRDRGQRTAIADKAKISCFRTPTGLLGCKLAEGHRWTAARTFWLSSDSAGCLQLDRDEDGQPVRGLMGRASRSSRSGLVHFLCRWARRRTGIRADAC